MKRLLIIVAVFIVAGGMGFAQSAGKQSGMEIEFLGNRAADMPSDADNVIIKVMNEKVGIKFKLSGFADYADISRQLNLRIAAGNPPDAFWRQSKAEVASLAGDKALLELTPYLSKLPNYRKLLNDETMLDAAKIDGKLYSLPTAASVNYGALYIRKDWLNKLGLKVPTTIAETLEVAKAFATMDPDGNGKKDTFGLSGLGINTFSFIFGGYGTMGAVYNTTNGANLHVLVENGKAVFDLYNPRYVQALTEVKKWVDTGVVDPEIFTHKSNDFWNKVYQGKAGIVDGRWPEFRKLNFDKMIHDVDPKAEWIAILPPKGPYGAYFGGFAKGGVNQVCLPVQLGEKKNEAKLAKVLELIDWTASAAGQTTINLGIEGVHHTLVDGKLQATDKLATELPWTWTLLLAGRNDLVSLPARFPYAVKDIDFCVNYPVLRAYDKLVGNFADDINKADIDRFFDDSVVKFVYGGQPLSQFGDFVKTMETKFNYKKYMDAVTKELKLK